MKLFSISALILCLVQIVVQVFADRSVITLYNGISPEESTYSLRLESNEPDLTQFKELNGTLSYCLTGTWFFYTEKGYYGEMTYLTVRGKETCAQLPENGYPSGPSAGKIVSIRFGGSQSNHLQPTFTFYDGVGLTGNATTYTGWEPFPYIISYEFSSLMLTGYFASIRLYQRNDTRGYSQCFKADPSFEVNYWTDMECYYISRGEVHSYKLYLEFGSRCPNE